MESTEFMMRRRQVCLKTRNINLLTKVRPRESTIEEDYDIALQPLDAFYESSQQNEAAKLILCRNA